MHLMFRALKYVLTASLAVAGMAAAQTTTTTTTTPAPAPDAAAQAPAVAPAPEAAPAPAPEATSTKKSATEEIVVTGSRVRRKDLNTPAPVTVVSRDQITASGRVSLGEFLQALPEQGNTVNAQVNNGNDGSINVALRSLGSNRTLVLLNGRRMVFGGTGAGAAVDLSTIPAAAIERIEILKDGASAIYGSDAIAGVVNVILRKRYNGTEVGGYAGTSGHSDGTTYDVHGLTGTAGDRGSMMFSVGYQEQKAAFSGDREFSKTTYNYDFDLGCFVNGDGACAPKADSSGGNSGTWPQGRFRIPGSACGSFADPKDPTSTFTPNPLQATHPALASICAQSKTGGTFMSDPTAPGTSKYVPFDGLLYNTNPTNYFITPSRRIQLFSTGDVNLGSEARAFFEASYVNRTSSQTLAPMPITNATIVTAPVFISKDNIYNPFGVTLTSWRRRSVEFGERFWKQDLDTFRVVAGLDGSLGEWAGPLAGWSWSADYNHGRTSGTQNETGQVQMSHLANAVGPSMIDPKTGKPACVLVAGDISTKVGGCVPMDVLHGVGTLSPDAAAYVSYQGVDFGHNQQDIWSANVSGELFKLMSDHPAGIALGADYRRESGSFINNPININDSSGNNSLSTNGGYNVKEAYGELVIPLVSGMPFVEDLEVQGAARWNDFSTFGSSTTYKLGLRYSPIRDLTARATYGTAFRAPNVGELYGGASDNYPSASDPCNKPKGAALIARCTASGVPGGNSADPATQFLTKNFANANLGPEEATTFTAGVVIQPQMVRNLSFTVDYYNMNVKKSIGLRGAVFILDQCYTATNQDKSMCDRILRDPNGQILQIIDDRSNQGSIHTTGIDFAVRYAMPTEDVGRFSLIVDGAYLNSFNTTDAVGVVINGAGNYDTFNSFAGGAMPRLKMNTAIFWTMGPLGAGVSGRYIGNYKECNSGVCTFDDTQARQVGHYLPFDLFASYTLKGWSAGTTSLVVGVNNVTDIQPPYIANASAANSDPSTYDYIGRFFYTRLTHSF